MGSKPRWGDEVGEELGDELPAPSVVGPDKNGIKTITEYFIEDEKKFKVVRKVKVKKVIQTVSKEVARRKQLKKFGKAADHSPGPSPSTTTVSEEIPLKLSLKTQKEEVPQETALDTLKKKEKTIVCRICSGDHFTLKCPYKELEEIANFKPEDVPLDKDDSGSKGAAASASGSAPGKYVPPNLRGKAGGAEPSGSKPWGDKGGDSMSRDRELPTLRVTNISEDTRDLDLRELFERFGAVQRIHLAKDKITKLSKGYAFISFYNEKEAERALNHLNGHGYDNLILQVDWAKRQ